VSPDHEEDAMTDRQDPDQQAVRRNPQKDPDDWKTGDEPMTGPQASYLETLAQEAGEDVDPTMTKAEASKRIDELQEKTGRGVEREG
jgi:Protein of unknown function (DUF3072)